jgi:chromo domain-containing protein 1
VQVQAKIELACKLNFKDMFASNDGEKDISLLDRKAFLVYHPEQHSEELAVITRWLLMHHVQIGNAHYEGAWEHFQLQIRKEGSGVIIVCYAHNQSLKYY